MLIQCPECELQVSDKAFACPHCGYPLKPEASVKRTRNSNKQKKLPNGFGQISQIKTRNLRKPWRAMVTVGKTPTGRPIVKALQPVSSFETYNDAYAALVEYHRNPYDLDAASMTVAELYDKWTDQYFPTLKSDSSSRSIKSAWAYCTSVYAMRAADLRARHIKGCMDEGTREIKGQIQHASAGTKERIKSMFNLMYDFAVEYEIVDRNYARTFKVSDEIFEEQETAKRGHIPFTDDEMQLLWENVNQKLYVDIILIQCYSGWRPQELGLIQLENVDLENWLFVGGMKTEAGKDRPVPIHTKIRSLVEHAYRQAEELGSQYLFNCTDSKELKMTYDKYANRFTKIRNELHLNEQHRPHDPRMHFVTMAKKYKVDEYAIKYIVGHSISDVTEKVYTEREISFLQEEIEKIK